MSMKLQLAPSVLSFDLTSLSISVPQLVRGGADIIHLDVMDGNWVPPITFITPRFFTLSMTRPNGGSSILTKSG